MRVRTFSGCNLHKTKDKTCLNGTTYLSQFFFISPPDALGTNRFSRKGHFYRTPLSLIARILHAVAYFC